jgi:glyoxylase-like metal-dependent hydrolase (beta-lactamase superfamily II)
LKIHAIQTGTVAVKERQRRGAGHGLRRRLNTMLDREWTPPLPIYAFAIEHPEGVIVVDTGETAQACEPGYFPRWHPYFRLGVREWVQPEEEIGPRLEALGIRRQDVRQVVLTHMHTDHAGGLHHFPDNEILVTKKELELASGGLGRIRGYVNNRFPEGFAPRAIDFEMRPYGPFPETVPLTSAGDVLVVALPGHTPGHVGVLVEDGDHAVLLAGDSSYTQQLLLEGAVDGVAPDDRIARETLERIMTFARDTPTVYVVAHDADSGARLSDRDTVPGGAVRAVQPSRD